MDWGMGLGFLLICLGVIGMCRLFYMAGWTHGERAERSRVRAIRDRLPPAAKAAYRDAEAIELFGPLPRVRLQ